LFFDTAGVNLDVGLSPAQWRDRHRLNPSMVLFFVAGWTHQQKIV
jgi:hypothetical protein